MLRRFWRFTTASRKRKLVSIFAVLALIGSSAAIAQLIINSGANGSASGTITSQTQTNPAVTVTGTTNPVLDPAAASRMGATLVNNTNQAVSLNSLSASFTSSPSNCAQYISFDVNGSQGSNGFALSFPLNFTPNETKTLVGTQGNGYLLIGLSPNTPASCASATWTATFTGATTP